MKPRTFFAPGRVNLIGEHTDYNDGFVLPVAIEYGTFTTGRLRSDRVVRVHSHYLKESGEFALDAGTEPERGLWLDFIEGITRVLQSRGIGLQGADLEIESTVPIGGGLSSSTALELSFALAMLSLAECEIDRKALALASQQANHTYVGTRGGLMDQLTILFGRRGQALLIDCRSLGIQYIPIDTKELAIVICDTQVKHNLAASEYNARRQECETGVEILRGFLPGILALRDVGLADLQMYQEALPETVMRRCRHVISENHRTLAAASALRAGELETVGRLMAQSHESLRDDYQVSCRQLDWLWEIASAVEGVIGARLTGGGFGGCTVNLVRRAALEDFQRIVAENYQRLAGHAPAIYVSEAGEAAREI